MDISTNLINAMPLVVDLLLLSLDPVLEVTIDFL